MSPKVSVIIPTYGGEKTIIRAVKSVLVQNYENYEIIVVDDNNPATIERKRTEEYMEEFATEKKVKYIKHPQNRNGSAARNTGFYDSDGEYICLLDDDDIFLQNKLRKQVEFLEKHKEFGACYCWRKQLGKEICGEEEGDLSASLLDLSFTPTTPSLMIRRECYEALNGFDESYRRHQDFEFLLRFYKKYQMGVVKEVPLGDDYFSIYDYNEEYNALRIFVLRITEDFDDLAFMYTVIVDDETMASIISSIKGEDTYNYEVLKDIISYFRDNGYEFCNIYNIRNNLE